MAQSVKESACNAGDHLSTQKTRVQSLDQEDLLEKETATHSSMLAQTVPWTEEPGRLQFMGHQESDMTEQLSTTTTQFKVYCFLFNFLQNPQGIVQLTRSLPLSKRTPSLLQTPSHHLVIQLCLTPSDTMVRQALPWDSPGKNTGVGCQFLFQGIFTIQESNPVSHIAGRFFTI